MEQSTTPTVSREALEAFLREVTSAAKKLGIYPTGHPASVKAAERPFHLLQELMAAGQSVVFAYTDGNLIGNGVALESKLLQEGLAKVLVESGLSSISFERGTTAEEFEKLLSQINIKKEQRDLAKFAEENHLRFITFGKLQYQLIRDGERVINENEIFIGGGHGSGGSDAALALEAERTMSDVLRKHPELLLQVLTRKLGGGGKGKGGGTGDGFGPFAGGGSGGHGAGVSGLGVGAARGSGRGGSGLGSGGGAASAGESGGDGSGVGYGGAGGGSGGGIGPGLGSGGGGRLSDSGKLQLAAGVGDLVRAAGMGAGMGGSGGTGVQFTPDDYKRLKEAFKEVDNEELLGLLVTALKMSLGQEGKASRSDVGKALSSFRELLAEREALELLPQLRAEVEELGLVEGDYLRALLANDATPKKIAHIEIENFKNDFFLGSVDPDNVDDVVGWLETISDMQYTEDFVKKFYAGLERQGYELTDSQHEALLRFASICAENKEAPISGIQLAELKERLAEPDIALREFQLLTNIVEKYYTKYVELDLYEEASTLLDLVIQKIDSEVIYAEGVSEHAQKVHQRMTSAQLAESLVARLIRNFDLVGKPMIPLLEKFSNLEPILVFTSYLCHKDRSVRITLIRILSGFGERTINAFKLVLSDRSLTARPHGQAELSKESWFRVRNLIFVLGNIPHPDSVAAVARFATDSDERVVMEALIALEKLGGPDSARAIAKMLAHPVKEISLKALHALGQIGGPAEYPYAEEYFLRNVTDRQAILPVLIKLDKQHSLTFLAQVLLGESPAYNRLFAKPDEELNELVVKTFILLKSVIFDDVLRKYVKQATRSIFGQFRKPESVKLAERYLKTLTPQG